MRRRIIALLVVIVAALGGVVAAAPTQVERSATVTESAVRMRSSIADVRVSTKFEIRCGWSEQQVSAAGGPRVSSGVTTIYAGTAQVSANNKDPRLIRFDAGFQTWCRDDLEVTGDDQQGYGLVWDGTNRLYAVFSATGTQGAPAEDFRRFANRGWLRSSSDASTGGGGAKVAVVASIDAGSGTPVAATFLTARLSSGRVNSFDVVDMALTVEGLVVDGRSFFSPRGIDRSPLACEGASPFDVRYVFDAALTQLTSVDADRCR